MAQKISVRGRAVDPDPHSFSLLDPDPHAIGGSGSRRGKFEGENRKNPRKKEENCNFIININ